MSIDPLAALAENQSQLQQRLLELTPTVHSDIRAAWEAAAAGALLPDDEKPKREAKLCPSQFLILITCPDENH